MAIVGKNCVLVFKYTAGIVAWKLLEIVLFVLRALSKPP